MQQLEHLLFYGADMGAQNASGNTALHICALYNQVSAACTTPNPLSPWQGPLHPPQCSHRARVPAETGGHFMLCRAPAPSVPQVSFRTWSTPSQHHPVGSEKGGPSLPGRQPQPGLCVSQQRVAQTGMEVQVVCGGGARILCLVSHPPAPPFPTSFFLKIKVTSPGSPTVPTPSSPWDVDISDGDGGSRTPLPFTT